MSGRSGPPRGVILAVAAGTAARLALAVRVPITVDEAYYAQWAAHLRPGYLDHPPLVGWLTGAGLALGHATLAARLPAILLLAATTLLAASLVIEVTAAVLASRLVSITGNEEHVQASLRKVNALGEKIAGALGAALGSRLVEKRARQALGVAERDVYYRFREPSRLSEREVTARRHQRARPRASVC